MTITILGTEIKKVYHPYIGDVYHCYKSSGRQKGNVAYCEDLWEVIKFIWE